MIMGRVVSADGGTVYAYDSFGSWSVTVGGVADPGLGALLEAIYRSEFVGPQFGPLGAAALHDLAMHTGGRVEYFGPTEIDVDVVY